MNKSRKCNYYLVDLYNVTCSISNFSYEWFGMIAINLEIVYINSGGYDELTKYSYKQTFNLINRKNMVILNDISK